MQENQYEVTCAVRTLYLQSEWNHKFYTTFCKISYAFIN